MKSNEKSTNPQFATGVSFQANGSARFVSEQVRNLGSQFIEKMSRLGNNTVPSKEGFAFEYFDAIDQQINLGGKYQVEVPSINAKNSPDIQIKNRATGKVIREQQLKRSSYAADQAAKSEVYGQQEIRTPKGQSQKPNQSAVKESNVSASDVSKGVKNPHQAVNEYRFKAAIAEISNAAAVGAITGAVVSALLTGLQHFLAVERGEMELDAAIAATFLNTLEGAVIGSVSSATFAAIPAFFPALIPILSSISVPLMAIGAYQMVNQIGQIIDHHEFSKRNALLEKIYRQEAHFFKSFEQEVVEFLNS